MQIPLPATLLSHTGGVGGIVDVYREAYLHEPFITVTSTQVFGVSDERVILDPRSCNGTNSVQIHVVDHPNGHAMLVAILDNLGKGASGAAVQLTSTRPLVLPGLVRRVPSDDEPTLQKTRERPRLVV